MLIAKDLSRSPVRATRGADTRSGVVAGTKRFPSDSHAIDEINRNSLSLFADFYFLFNRGSLGVNYIFGPGVSASRWDAMQGADYGIERLRLMLGVELLFKPCAGSHRSGRQIEKAGHGVVHCRGIAARIHAPKRHAASLKQPLGGRIGLKERQDRPPNLQIFKELLGNMNGCLAQQQQWAVRSPAGEQNSLRLGILAHVVFSSPAFTGSSFP